jgi:hypothetical protein
LKSPEAAKWNRATAGDLERERFGTIRSHLDFAVLGGIRGQTLDRGTSRNQSAGRSKLLVQGEALLLSGGYLIIFILCPKSQSKTLKFSAGFLYYPELFLLSKIPTLNLMFICSGDVIF